MLRAAAAAAAAAGIAGIAAAGSATHVAAWRTLLTARTAADELRAPAEAGSRLCSLLGL